MLKAAAWTVPAVAVAVGTPALAASPLCSSTTYHHSDGLVEWLIITGESLTATFLVDYPHATAINIDGQLVWKSADTGVQAGHTVTVPLAVCDPAWVQVDGTNVHYYGNGVFK